MGQLPWLPWLPGLQPGEFTMVTGMTARGNYHGYWYDRPGVGADIPWGGCYRRPGGRQKGPGEGLTPGGVKVTLS